MAPSQPVVASQPAGPQRTYPWQETLAEGLDLTWSPSPYLHVGDDAIYNPHTDSTITEGDPHYSFLRQWTEHGSPPVAGKTEEMGPLIESAWVVRSDHDLDNQYRIKYVQLEAHTVCNQSCYFCPVSLAPRAAHSMSMELYEDIARQIAELGEPIESVFMIAYNEPTADPRFIEQVATLKRFGLPPSTLTNGSGLTHRRVDQLIELGGLRFMSINLSTMDRERYAKDRGKDQLPMVMRHLDYAKDKQVAEQMDIVVLGTDDEHHHQDFEEISRYFEGTRFTTKSFVVNDRAGYLDIGLTGDGGKRRLGGCDYMGSRPIQHLHINPHGQCLLCCQDYDEKEVVGDLREHSLAEVLVSPAFAKARRLVYGLDAAPERYICKGCRYSLKR